MSNSVKILIRGYDWSMFSESSKDYSIEKSCADIYGYDTGDVHQLTNMVKGDTIILCDRYFYYDNKTYIGYGFSFNFVINCSTSEAEEIHELLTNKFRS